jgi:hypothetical protein
VKPPILNPNNIKLHTLTSPWYSGEKNKNGTPKKEPNDSVTIAKSRTQKINPKKLYFKCAINKRIGKKSRINKIFLSIKQNFLKCIEN